MHAQGERDAQAAGAEHLDAVAGVVDQAGGAQGVDVDDTAGLEAAELAEVDDRVFLAERVVEAAQLGQALRQRHLAALEALGQPRGAGELALGAAARGLALAGGDAAADALARTAAARRGMQIVQAHGYSASVLAAPGVAAAPTAGTVWAKNATACGESAGMPSIDTRWRTLCTMPRIAGESSCSTVWCSFFSPSAATVAFWSYL